MIVGAGVTPATPPKTKTHLRIERRIEANSLAWQIRILRNIANTEQLREAVEAIQTINQRIMEGL